MLVHLEELVPYDESIQWQISEAYYARRGLSAWTEGEIPYESTSNAPFARQHATFLARLEEASSGPVYVLELGAGLGQFAVAFLRAVDELGEGPGTLADRVRFVLSDVVASNVRQAVATPALAPLVAAGRVLPAVFDAHSARLRSLDDYPLDMTFAMAVANYVCDVTPVQIFRKDGEQFLEKYVRVCAQAPEGERSAAVAARTIDGAADPEAMSALTLESEWRPVDLDERLEPEHADALRELVADFQQATVPWFGRFLDLVGALKRAMRPGGVLVVNEYGSCDARELQGLSDPPRLRYGSTTHAVNLSMFDTWCPRVGLGVARSRAPFRQLNHAAIFYGPASSVAIAAFEGAFVDQAWGDDFLEFKAAARAHAEAGQHIQAVRQYRRALALDPGSAELHHRIGEACLLAGKAHHALDYLLAGLHLDPEHRWDFEFLLGRACHALQRYIHALRWYGMSAERQDHPTTRLNMALAHDQLGDFRAAYLACRESLRLEPTYERARLLFEDIKTRWCEEKA